MTTSLAIGFFLVPIAYLCAAGILIFKKLHTIEGLLTNSKIIVDSKYMLIANTWWGRLYRLNIASTVLLFPDAFEKRGLLSVEDRIAFPATLKTIMTIIHILGTMICFTGLIVGALKFGGWIT